MSYIVGAWKSLSSRGKTVVSVTLLVVLLAAFYLALVYSEAFTRVVSLF